MTSSAQPLIDRLYDLVRRATRLRHFAWAAVLEERMLIEVREAQFELWQREQRS